MSSEWKDCEAILTSARDGLMSMGCLSDAAYGSVTRIECVRKDDPMTGRAVFRGMTVFADGNAPLVQLPHAILHGKSVGAVSDLALTRQVLRLFGIADDLIERALDSVGHENYARVFTRQVCDDRGIVIPGQTAESWQMRTLPCPL